VTDELDNRCFIKFGHCRDWIDDFSDIIRRSATVTRPNYFDVTSAAGVRGVILTVVIVRNLSGGRILRLLCFRIDVLGRNLATSRTRMSTGVGIVISTVEFDEQ
jgi:hypothetical protein